MPTITAAPVRYRIVPIRAEFLTRIRAGIDDQGQSVERLAARGGEPLRDCLRRAAPGEPILLASHTPMALAGPYKEYGAVFVAAQPQPAPRTDVLPFDGERPYLGARFVLRAHGRDEHILDAALATPQSAEATLHAFFGRDDVAFVDVRFTPNGCYALRLVRD